MPRKFSNGRATNIPTDEWTREYKRLQHRINFVEKQVETGLDFPEITPHNRMPADVEPTIQQIQVNQTNSKTAFGENAYSSFRTRIHRITEETDMTFTDIVAATNNDPELSLTRQCLLDVKSKAEVPIRYRKVYDELKTNLGVVTRDDKIVLPKDLRYPFLQLLHANHIRAGKMKENAKLVWWPLMDKEIDAKTAECVTCIRNGKNLKTKLNSKQIGKLKTLTAPNQELQIDFYGPFKYKSKKNTF